MNVLDEGLRLFTRPEPIAEEGPLLRALLEIPGFVLHLRKPSLPRPLLEEILRALDPATLGRVMLHDQPGLLEKFPVRGIVWNARHPLPEDAEASKEEIRVSSGRRPVFSISAHGLDLVVSPPAGLDEMLFAPVYPSLSKAGHLPTQEIEIVRKTLSAGTPLPVIALGGIEEFRFLEVLGAGFSGAAVLGTLWEKFSATGRCEDLVEQAKRLRELWVRAAEESRPIAPGAARV